ncbi:hypothetical protein ANANG_G00244030 [Anguilla anguilla]|uniref:Fibronectin type-III domain-containing protein n=1 Tax=Anguilla anguilla TaxID=7936 RepID=A0A9D3RM90_ANGAN|nr:hypothetical protein ANANG_G00244030 [Anguilla anguilla]
MPWCACAFQIRYWRQPHKQAAADRVRTAGLETTARDRPEAQHPVPCDRPGLQQRRHRAPLPPRHRDHQEAPPSRPPGNVSWKTDGSWVTVRWDRVKALKNESAVLGYKVLYKHEGLSALKVLEKDQTSVSLPLPKDDGYVVLEIRSWGRGRRGGTRRSSPGIQELE